MTKTDLPERFQLLQNKKQYEKKYNTKLQQVVLMGWERDCWHC